MNRTQLIFFLIFFSCSTAQKQDQTAANDSLSKVSTQDDWEVKRKELEKIGYNYSSRIVSKEHINFEGQELTFVQAMVDSAGKERGKVFVRLITDSTFSKLYILDGNELKYFIGDHIMTNRIDTLRYSDSHSTPFQFSLRWKHYITVFMGGSDPLSIYYFDKKGIFDLQLSP
jgi:hypothetical protein